MKTFNTTGTCRPKEHYMVDITERLEIIRKMVVKGDYFCINRGRQYGKTTTLEAISSRLSDEFCVLKISFEGADDSAFATAATVNANFLKRLKREARNVDVNVGEYLKAICPSSLIAMEDVDFSDVVEEMCTISAKPVVVLIDEVDQAGNNEGFIKFLGELRTMYLDRATHPTFHSVILAGVYDIKNLKLKMRSDEQHQYNSPWNIAVPFDVDMSLPAKGITGMLDDYAREHNMQFDTTAIGQTIYDYTSGYPFLVSRLCQIIDSERYGWNNEGVLKSVNQLLKEGNTLFDDIQKKITQFSNLSRMLREIIFSGQRVVYNYYDADMNVAVMFNFVKEQNGTAAISCRIFETWLYNYFISNDKGSPIYQNGEYDKPWFIHDGYLDMRRLLERFCAHFNEIYRPGHDDKFVEANGRKIFLTYLRPVINGTGNYYCEAQTRNLTRTDVVVDYLGKQYVIELKIWRGESYNERGEQQLAEYLDYYHLTTGYMLSFCFNKNKQPGIHEVKVGNRIIIEAIV